MKRRKFLQYAGLAAGAATFPLHGFSINPMPRLPFLQALAASGNPYNRVLVLVQLIGGNDGLNTFIPLDQYDKLADARPDLLIPENQVLGLSGTFTNGLHPSMTHLQNMYNDGLVSVVQSVGYPNQDYSHFRSTDIWMSASNSEEYLETGWLGRYLMSEYPGFPTGYPNTDMPDPLAIQIGSIISLALMGDPNPMGFAISDPDAFYQFISDFPEPVPNTPYGNELEYIRLVTNQAETYYDAIKGAADVGQNLSAMYPTTGANRLADQLRIVAQLISGGLKTPVYIVTLDGFDTHSEQIDTVAGPTQGLHAELLRLLSEAIGAFQDDLKLLGADDRVAGMTFSEFGRTIAENASYGTDHGAGAPLIVFGKKVIPGIIGSNPDIPQFVNGSEDLPMQHDFRSVYASALQDWFGIENPESILYNTYPILPIFEAPISGVHNTRGLDPFALGNFPNPFQGATTIRFTMPDSAQARIVLYDQSGRLIDTIADRHFAEGENQVSYRNNNLPAGQYVYRLEVGSKWAAGILIAR